MKVLKKGRPQKGWATQTSCTGAGNGDGGCGAKLLVEEGDLFITESNVRDETTRFETFRCCECGVETDLKGVPSIVALRLPSKRVWDERQAERQRDDGHDSLEGNRG